MQGWQRGLHGLHGLQAGGQLEAGSRVRSIACNATGCRGTAGQVAVCGVERLLHIPSWRPRTPAHLQLPRATEVEQLGRHRLSLVARPHETRTATTGQDASMRLVKQRQCNVQPGSAARPAGWLQPFTNTVAATRRVTAQHAGTTHACQHDLSTTACHRCPPGASAQRVLWPTHDFHHAGVNQQLAQASRQHVGGEMVLRCGGACGGRSQQSHGFLAAATPAAAAAAAAEQAAALGLQGHSAASGQLRRARGSSAQARCHRWSCVLAHSGRQLKRATVDATQRGRGGAHCCWAAGCGAGARAADRRWGCGERWQVGGIEKRRQDDAVAGAAQRARGQAAKGHLAVADGVCAAAAALLLLLLLLLLHLREGQRLLKLCRLLRLAELHTPLGLQLRLFSRLACLLLRLPPSCEEPGGTSRSS